MLVLARKSGETIRIGPDMVVTVLGVHGGRVRLGIACPQHVHILRGELCSPVQEPEGGGASTRTLSRAPNELILSALKRVKERSMPRLIDLQARLPTCPEALMHLSSDEVLVIDIRSGMMPGDFVEKKLRLVIDRSDGRECCACEPLEATDDGPRRQPPT